VARVERTTVQVLSTHVGEVTANSSVDVVAHVSIVVADVMVAEGQTVRRGQVLVRLDPKDLTFQVAQARATHESQRVQVDAARASVQTQRARLAQVMAGPAAEQVRQAEEQVRQARAGVAFSRDQLRRQEELFAQGYVSREQVEAARLDTAVQEGRLRSAEEQLALLRRDPRPEAVQIARAQVQEAEVAYRQALARLEQSRVSLFQAQTMLADSTVVAPVDGVVGRKFAERGQAVTSSTPLIRLIDVDPAVIVVAITERDLHRIQLGFPVTVRTDALPGEVFSGRIASISPILATSTRTADVRVDVPNVARRLRPGMFVNVEILVSRNANVIAVPVDAVLEREGGSAVFVIVESTAQARPVRTGISDGAVVEITSGLTEGEIIAVAGHRTLRDGMPVVVPGAPGGGQKRP
jgi:HlyD family secretion protein